MKTEARKVYRHLIKSCFSAWNSVCVTEQQVCAVHGSVAAGKETRNRFTEKKTTEKSNANLDICVISSIVLKLSSYYTIKLKSILIHSEWNKTLGGMQLWKINHR